ncbi:DUF4253 domain-containing protein [Longimicrobium sp.]|uniref:DUF4253 domain-containing protein n=1 Tax=Longimicrobium sp. TaxID=2029185 RepID=UPI002BC3EB7D|nr:DUF4253 domain-containing protein [Longimicrobium sp.]HSU16420.1 DUF4253 domain-containing protein [Longimicrobium sp.]
MFESFILLILQATRMLPVLFVALLGFLFAPVLKRRRVPTALAAALAVVLWNDLYFVTLGASPWRWALLLPLAAVAVGPWVMSPLLSLRRPVSGAAAPSEPYDPARHPLARGTVQWAVRTVEALEAEGFARVDDVAMRSAGGRSLRVVVMDHAGESVRAVVLAGTATALEPADGEVTFQTVLADGRRVVAGNGGGTRGLRGMPGVVALRLPDVRDPVRVLAAFWKLLRTTPGAERRSLPPGTTAAEITARGAREAAEQLVAAGWYRRAGDGYRYTPRGAVLSSWQHVFPLRQVYARAGRREQDRELERLGLPLPPREPEPGPVGWWLSFGGMNVAWAAALLVLGLAWPALASRGGLGAMLPVMAAARADSIVPARLPDGFAVPGDFPGAVRALERLAGARARPLTVDDGFSGGPSDAMMVPMDTARVQALLAAAQPWFAANGFVLFHTQEFDGVHGEPDALAVYPSRDPFSLVLKLNTNGGNYGIGPKEIADWLRETDRDHPFTLTSAGFDYVEGRFRRPLSADEAMELAARVARFCPDVVSQGTGSVRALAEEMRQRRILYCWWD